MTEIEQMILIGLILMSVIGGLLLLIYINLRARIISMEDRTAKEIESLRHYARGEMQHISTQQAEFTRQMIEANRRE